MRGIHGVRDCLYQVSLFRFMFYEDWEENYRMRKTYMEELERKFDEASESDSVSVDTNTSER